MQPLRRPQLDPTGIGGLWDGSDASRLYVMPRYWDRVAGGRLSLEDKGQRNPYIKLSLIEVS